MFAAIARHLIMLTVETLSVDSKQAIEIKKSINKDISELLAKYEAELYQDRYLPEYQKNAREISRRERAEADAKRERDLAALNRVASLSEGPE